jgi:hypothetical protein
MKHEPWTMNHEPWSMKHEPWTMKHEAWSMKHEAWTMNHPIASQRVAQFPTQKCQASFCWPKTTRRHDHRHSLQMGGWEIIASSVSLATTVGVSLRQDIYSIPRRYVSSFYGYCVLTEMVVILIVGDGVQAPAKAKMCRHVGTSYKYCMPGTVLSSLNPELCCTTIMHSLLAILWAKYYGHTR